MSLETGRSTRWGSVAAAGVFWLAGGCGKAMDQAEISPALAEPAEGYPAGTSRLTLRVTRDYEKLCHATLVHPDWALTAAHCFASVEPTARGSLEDFGRNLSVSDVVFHPAALADGSTSLGMLRQTTDFAAAHDLALIPVVPPLEDIDPVPRWLPMPDCALSGRLDVRGRFGKLGPNDEAQTAEAHLIGSVDAAALLGPEHAGSLLSAEGPSVGPGDSGSGMTASFRELAAVASGCARWGGAGDEVLVGVIQDANAERSTLPFGLTPLYPFEHSRWLAEQLEIAPPAPPPRPRLDP